MKMVCKFYAEVILARNNSGYLHTFFCLKKKALNNLKKTFISIISE